jgi:hypothetical protein
VARKVAWAERGMCASLLPDGAEPHASSPSLEVEGRTQLSGVGEPPLMGRRWRPRRTAKSSRPWRGNPCDIKTL